MPQSIRFMAIYFSIFFNYFSNTNNFFNIFINLAPYSWCGAGTLRWSDRPVECQTGATYSRAKRIKQLCSL